MPSFNNSKVLKIGQTLFQKDTTGAILASCKVSFWGKL